MCCCKGEENCCWNECRAENPPEMCLQGLDSFWMKDPRKNVWVAQEHTENLDLQTTNASLTNPSYPTETNDIDNTTSKYCFGMIFHHLTSLIVLTIVPPFFIIF